MDTLKTNFEKSVSRKDFGLRYLAFLSNLIQNLDMDVVSQIIEEIQMVCDRGKTLYLIGNGGSAATASHYANDLRIGIQVPGKPNLKAVSLADNIALLTAIANDEGYQNVFVQQLDGVLTADDIVMAFSVSGNSENVIQAMMYAQMIGATTIGCTGFDGGRLRELTDISLHVPTCKGEYGPVEDVFSIVGHLIYSFLKMDRANQDNQITVHDIFKISA